MATEITLEVRCMGCGELIARPSDADMEMFRLGINIHNNDACAEGAELKLRLRGEVQGEY